jgi:hypothetical protein
MDEMSYPIDDLLASPLTGSPRIKGSKCPNVFLSVKRLLPSVGKQQ